MILRDSFADRMRGGLGELVLNGWCGCIKLVLCSIAEGEGMLQWCFFFCRDWEVGAYVPHHSYTAALSGVYPR